VANTRQIPLVMRIPPPLLFVATFFAGVGLHHLVPVPLGTGSLVAIEHLAGIALMISGGVLALSAAGTFLLKRTTLIPFSSPSTLVIGGPFRFTRNPMYVSLVLVYLGVAGDLAQLWPLLLLPLPVLLIQCVVIPFEETRMRELFGEQYEQYCRRVNRWI
jgi:protein-S-isoprenylcysteine O-methyltransferase Ste14